MFRSEDDCSETAKSASPEIGSARESKATSDLSSRSDIQYKSIQCTIPQVPDSEACGVLQRRSCGQVYNAEPPGALFSTSPLQIAAWRAAELLRVSRSAHVLRAPADRRLTAGTSPMCIYLCTLGSAYKNPGYSSYVREDGTIVITYHPHRERQERVVTRGPLLLPLKQLKEHSL